MLLHKWCEFINRIIASMMKDSISKNFTNSSNKNGLKSSLKEYPFHTDKGHLISKGLFNVIISTKQLTKFFKDFCPGL